MKHPVNTTASQAGDTICTFSVSEVLCLAPQLQNGRQVGGYDPVHRPRERVRLECDPGYTLNGSREIECQDDATWDPPVPVCVEDTRRQPEQSRRMKHPVNTTASQAGDTICTFSVSEVLCLAPQLQNGRQVGGYDPVHRPRERVRLECDPGYTLNGSREIECQDDATWDPPVPVCVEDTRRQPEQSRRMKHPVNTTASQAGDTICTFSVSEVLCLAPQLQNGRQVGGYDPVHRPRERVRLECDPGYTLNGSREIECQDDATWDPPVPVCVEEVLCLAPQLQNGREVGGYSPVHRRRERVRLECDPGYSLNGSREIECQDDATWDPPVPVCVEDTRRQPEQSRRMKHPVNTTASQAGDTICTFSVSEVLCLAPQLQNGRQVGGYDPVHRPRERVRLECDPGYTLNGSREIECQDDATWDPPVPVCVEDTRRQPEQSRSMKHPVNTTASQAGDTICTFSVSEVLCLAPQLQNGRQVGGYDPVHRPRERVRLECDPGYTLNGSREIECQDDATWDPPVPVCVEDTRRQPEQSRRMKHPVNTTASQAGDTICTFSVSEVLCLAPQLQNGRQVGGYDPVHRPRERVRLECDPGYTLNGSREIECQDDATWDPPVPVCVEELRCPSPPAIANGKPRSQAGTVFTSGMSVTYSCEPGYSLTGQASLNCMASGTWSSPIPRCEDTRRQPEQSRRMKHPVNTTASQAGDTICTFSVSEVLCLAPQLQNGRQVGGYDPVHRPRERVRLECDPGYTLNGSREIECQDDATWDPPVPVCTYSCEPGYSLSGQASLNCTASGTWSSPIPRCEGVLKVLCLAPQLQNGREVGGYSPVHRRRERVRLECDPGYSLNGSREIECQDDATWDPPVPVCVEDTRRQPEQSRRMKHPVNTTASQAGDTICTFSVSEVLCLAPQLQNGRQVGGYDPVHRPRERVRLECDPGYTLNGSREIECQDDATWDPPVPVCVEGKYTRRQPEQSRSMKHPVNTTASQAGDTICTFSVSEVLCLAPQLQNGRQVGGYDPVHRPRERVRLECDPGYTLNGSREIECQDDATWDPPVPVCSGMSVTYSCEPGYSLSGQASLNCTASGTWSSPIPRCEGVLSSVT
ncbi:complement receptor type 2-like [Carettochelys insculpta]|uniref:complement receptor type 2-like n=1 Tax=Carettochelys insculpta TaxID=44489 RepID=UPI003EB781FE